MELIFNSLIILVTLWGAFLTLGFTKQVWRRKKMITAARQRTLNPSQADFETRFSKELLSIASQIPDLTQKRQLDVLLQLIQALRQIMVIASSKIEELDLNNGISDKN